MFPMSDAKINDKNVEHVNGSEAQTPGLTNGARLGAQQSSWGLLGGSNPPVSKCYASLTGTIAFADGQHGKMPTMRPPDPRQCYGYVQTKPSPADTYFAIHNPRTSPNESDARLISP